MGYLEWGKDQKMFLFQVEGTLLSKLIADPMSVIHPLTVLPMAGQLLLLISLFQKNPGKKITYTGLSFLGILMLFIFFIGLVSFHIKVIASVIPFIVTGILTIRYHLK